jgi:hypothetical protein
MVCQGKTLCGGKGFTLNFNERIFAILVARLKKVAGYDWKSFSKT